MRKTTVRLAIPVVAVCYVLAVAPRASRAAENCTADNWHSDQGSASVAASREQRLPAASQTDIDPGMNGGIRVHGWNNADVLVKACVRASAPTAEQARVLLDSVHIVRGPGEIKPEGPHQSSSNSWSVSYEIWMPSRSNIQAHGVNGGIALDSLDGQIRFHTQNGGVTLNSLAGDVEGSTQNGGLTVELVGSSWQGAGLRVETQNGGVHVRVPEGYSADFEASTVNGGMHSDFPVQRDGKTVSFNLGSGGAPIRTKTTNGGVHIGKS